MLNPTEKGIVFGSRKARMAWLVLLFKRTKAVQDHNKQESKRNGERVAALREYVTNLAANRGDAGVHPAVVRAVKAAMKRYEARERRRPEKARLYEEVQRDVEKSVFKRTSAIKGDANDRSVDVQFARALEKLDRLHSLLLDDMRDTAAIRAMIERAERLLREPPRRR